MSRTIGERGVASVRDELGYRPVVPRREGRIAGAAAGLVDVAFDLLVLRGSCYQVRHIGLHIITFQGPPHGPGDSAQVPGLLSQVNPVALVGQFQGIAHQAVIARNTQRNKCLDTGISPAGCAVFLSGRISVELVSKCARAGIEMMAAIDEIFL